MSKKVQSQILSNGDVLIMGVIGDWSEGLDSATFTASIREQERTGSLKVFINSPGGDVVDGLAIYNELKAHPANVEVEVTALAASMASVIMLAGDVIRMPSNGLVMIHNPWTSAAGDKNEFTRITEQLEKMGESMVGIYSRRTGRSEADLQKMMDAETWLTADEALELGFIDEILPDVSAEEFTKINEETVALMPKRMAAKVRGYQTAAAESAANPANKELNTMAKKVNGNAAPGENVAELAEQKVKAQAEIDAKAEAKAGEDVEAAVNAAAAKAVKLERSRVDAISSGCEKIGLSREFANGLIADGTSLVDARGKILDEAAKASEQGAPSNPHIKVGASAVEKFQTAAVASIIQRSGKASLIKKSGGDVVNAGEFRGYTLVDLARHQLEVLGQKTHGMGRESIVKAALASVHQGTSDFAVLLENTMHKILQAAYTVTPDTWSRFCATGSVTDFRAHNRYRTGSFGSLDGLNENGEYKNKVIPDGEKSSITATTKGNIIALTRQAIVNDDLGAFESLASQLGRAASLTVEKDVYATLALNGGMGPVMSDGDTLFHANHNNIGSAGAPSVASFGDAADKMAAQTAVGNTEEILDLSPEVFLGPLGLARSAGVINDAVYDPDTANKLQKPNAVNGQFSDIVGTGRLIGTPWYAFADADVAPVLEVAFLNGVTEPYLDMEDSWRTDGVEWKVRLDYGVAGIDHRGAVRNAG